MNTTSTMRRSRSFFVVPLPNYLRLGIAFPFNLYRAIAAMIQRQFHGAPPRLFTGTAFMPTPATQIAGDPLSPAKVPHGSSLPRSMAIITPIAAVRRRIVGLRELSR
ncbi:hypothetical protein BHE74_00005307 [Ensete ventricosum]|nr:hypothetical protein GW17_00014174 [Ensete ventricosum]RWW85971.1 hypothetical protein BHE74_00005307 [Ensete ventricosum]RZS20334.1 hypothetical protein BHM03_00052830 [Ensete ventricosum]